MPETRIIFILSEGWAISLQSNVIGVLRVFLNEGLGYIV